MRRSDGSCVLPCHCGAGFSVALGNVAGSLRRTRAGRDSGFGWATLSCRHLSREDPLKYMLPAGHLGYQVDMHHPCEDRDDRTLVVCVAA